MESQPQERIPSLAAIGVALAAMAYGIGLAAQPLPEARLTGPADMCRACAPAHAEPGRRAEDFR